MGSQKSKSSMSTHSDNNNNNNNNISSEERRRRELWERKMKAFKPGSSSTSSCSSAATYRGRPTIPDGFDYVEPTLFQCAHPILKLNDGVTLYLGPKLAASQEAYTSLVQANIRGIVNCTNRVPCHHQQSREELQSSSSKGCSFPSENWNIKYCQVPVNDVEGADILVYLQGATAFIDALLQKGNCGTSNSPTGSSNSSNGYEKKMMDTDLSGSSVLVHCEQGMSRSSTVVIAYLMRFHGMSRDEAYITCKKGRPLTNPNPGFWNQLAIFEGWLQDQNQQQQEQELLHDVAPSTTTTTTATEATAASTTTTTTTAMTAKHVFCKQWATQSNAVYCTCKEIPHRMMQEDCWQQFLNQRDEILGVPPLLSQSREPSEPPSNTTASLSHFIFVCLDFCWGRGVLDVDLEWLTFILQHLEEARKQRRVSSSGPEGTSIWDQVQEIIDDDDSEFNSYWSGEIYESQMTRLKAQLHPGSEEGG